MPTGSCHCGATRFALAEPPRKLTSCNCSFCFKRGALWSYHDPKGVAFASRDDAIYTWGSQTVRHHFCPHCGCGTFSVSPRWVDGKLDRNSWRYGVNARLLDDFDIEVLPVVTVDGRSANWFTDEGVAR